MSRGRILIADDEPTFLTSTAELLRGEGFHVDTVEDAEGALQAIAAAPYDLLITDLEMPGNADLDLVQQVAHMSGGLPIIIITGFPSVRSAVASIELPVAGPCRAPRRGCAPIGSRSNPQSRACRLHCRCGP